MAVLSIPKSPSIFGTHCLQLSGLSVGLLAQDTQDQKPHYTRYDGSMKPQEREEAIQAFQENPRVTIMLVSLKAGNAGLVLTAAQHVLIMEPRLE